MKTQTLRGWTRRMAAAATCLSAWLAGTAFFALPATAQDYPGRPITLIAPYPPGGSVDAVARALAQGLSARLGKPVVVDNRPGAGGTLGARLVANAKPDGYTLLLATDGSLIAGPLVVSPAPYQLGAFNVISRFASVPLVLVTRPSAYQDIHALVAAARKQPGAVTMGSPGIGTPAHFMIERLKAGTNTRILHVPYKGGAPLQSDLMGGQINAYFCTANNCAALIREGSLKALGVSAAARTAQLPAVPTFTEQGLQGLTADNWFGLAGPAGLPASVESALRSAVVAVTADPNFQRQMREGGIDMTEQRSPAALRLYLEQEQGSLAKLLAARPLDNT